MINIILRFVYKTFKQRMEDIIVDEYVKGIPEDVVETAFTVMSSNKKKLKRLNDFLAFRLHRRMSSDPKNSLRYQGMFMQLKINDSFIFSTPDVKEKTVLDNKKQEGKIDYDEAIKTAESFADIVKEQREG